MEEQNAHAHDEFSDLEKEIDSFQKEKHRIKSIVGQIGGIPTFNTKLFNIIFAAFILVCFILSLMCGGVVRLAIIEAAVAAVSIKLMILIHNQSRVNHFQLWILTSIEWRFNELIQKVNENKNNITLRG